METTWKSVACRFAERFNMTPVYTKIDAGRPPLARPGIRYICRDYPVYTAGLLYRPSPEDGFVPFGFKTVVSPRATTMSMDFARFPSEEEAWKFAVQCFVARDCRTRQDERMNEYSFRSATRAFWLERGRRMPDTVKQTDMAAWASDAIEEYERIEIESIAADPAAEHPFEDHFRIFSAMDTELRRCYVSSMDELRCEALASGCADGLFGESAPEREAKFVRELQFSMFDALV